MFVCNVKKLKDVLVKQCRCLSADSGPPRSEPRGWHQQGPRPAEGAGRSGHPGQCGLLSEVRGPTLGAGSLSWEVQAKAAGQLTPQLPE